MNTTQNQTMTPAKRQVSSINPGDIYTAPSRVVLHESLTSTEEVREYVTHIQNMQDGGYFWGHYFSSRVHALSGLAQDQANNAALAEALIDYAKRCQEMRVDPLPPESIQRIPPGVARPDLKAPRLKPRPGGLEHDTDEVHAG